MRPSRTESSNVEHWRAETPGTQDHIHLNNAGSSLMPSPVTRTIHDHVNLEAQLGGYDAAAERAEQIQEAYDSVATLIGARAGNIAFAQSATIAYSQALSSIPFAVGDVILTTRNDYVSNQIQFLSLRKRFGVRVMHAPDDEHGGVDVAALSDLVTRHRPKLVCVTHVPTNSGLVQDVEAVGAVCRAAGALYLVDACQSAGQMRIDVERIGCDFLAVTFRKFMRGPRGVGFLYVSDRVLGGLLEPMFIDFRGAEWLQADLYRPSPQATRFETFESSPALVLAAGEAARYATAVGMETIERRVRALAARLRAALGSIPGVRLLDHGPELCGIVSVFLEGRDHCRLADEMRRMNVNVGAQLRRVAVMDYDRRGIDRSLRVSPHYYNTEEEIDRAASVLADLSLL